MWNSSSIQGTQVSSVELEFIELEFLENIQVELEFHIFFLKVSFRYNSIVQKSSFTLKLDFLKIEFQNRDISLNSFKHGHFIQKFVRNG